MNASDELSNVTDFTGDPVNREFGLFIIVLGSVMLLSGIVGNGLLLLVMWRRRGLRAFHNSFIANLALADLVVTCSGLPGFLLDLARGTHPVVNQLHCRLNAVVLCTSYAVSIMSLILISFNRYIKVCHRAAFRHLFSTRRNLLICASTWGLCLVLNAPAFVPSDTPYGYDRASHICNARAGRIGVLEYSSVAMILLLLVPVLLISFFNAAIFRHWRSSRQRLRKVREAGKGSGRSETRRKSGKGCKGAKASWRAFVTKSILDLTGRAAGGGSSSEDKSRIELKDGCAESTASTTQTTSLCDERDSGAEESSPCPTFSSPLTPQDHAAMERKDGDPATITTEAEITTTSGKGNLGLAKPGPAVGGGETDSSDKQADDARISQEEKCKGPSKTTTDAVEPDMNRSINYLDRIADAIATIEKNSRKLAPRHKTERVAETGDKPASKEDAGSRSSRRCRPTSAQLPRALNGTVSKKSKSRRQASTFRVQRNQYPNLYGIEKRGQKDGKWGSTKSSKSCHRPKLASLLLDSDFLWWSDNLADQDADVIESADPTISADDSFSAADISTDFEEEPDAEARERSSGDPSAGSLDRSAEGRASVRGVWHPSIDRVAANGRYRARERKARPVDWRRAVSMVRRRAASDVALLRSLVVISALLFVLYSPFAAYLFLTFFLRSDVPPEVPVAFTLLLFINCAINWIIYGIMNTAFRQAYASTLKNVSLCCVRLLSPSVAEPSSPLPQTGMRSPSKA